MPIKNPAGCAEGARVGKKRLALLIAVLMAIVMPLVPAAGPNGAVRPQPDRLSGRRAAQISFIDDFYQTRSGGRIHSATDIMTNGVKGLPVVAAFDGVVSWIGGTCCYLSIDHGGGYETWYIHLNNDTPGTDDGAGMGHRPRASWRALQSARVS